MRKILYCTAAVFTAAVLGSSLAIAQINPPYVTNQSGANSTRVTIQGEPMNNQTVDVNSGDLVDVTMPENLSSGYSWWIHSSNSQGALVEFQGRTNEPSPSGAPGSTGTAAFHFVTFAKGKMTITFFYLHPWESNQPPAKSTTITINVL
jgi:predicted secreted protein